MARLNTAEKQPAIFTAEGAPARRQTHERALTRSVMANFLWENGFYEDGQSNAERIADLCTKVSARFIADLAIEARHTMHLRHVPLFLLVQLLKKERTKDVVVRDVIAKVIARADEPGELITLYRADKANKGPLDNQLKRGLAQSLEKFDEYQLAKYDRDNANWKIRDVIRMVSPKPSTPERSELYRKAVQRQLASPDTWEVGLSAAKSDAEKAEVFTRLLETGKLPYLALLRNLRKMSEVGVSRDLIETAILARKGAQRVLPFRFTAAARIVPQFEPVLDQALLASLEEMEGFEGRTVILVDVSYSMKAKLSSKSDMSRMDAAATLASIFPGRADIMTFSSANVWVPQRKGMAGVDAIMRSQEHRNTYLAKAVEAANAKGYDRLIVITDEQASGERVGAPLPGRPAYMVNVASEKHSVAFGPWVSLTGFSENILRFIRATEADRD